MGLIPFGVEITGLSGFNDFGVEMLGGFFKTLCFKLTNLEVVSIDFTSKSLCFGSFQ